MCHIENLVRILPSFLPYSLGATVPPSVFLCASLSQDIRILLVSAGFSICVQCPHSSMCPLVRFGIFS